MKEEKLFCLLGNPVSHSLSPLMHRTAFKAMDLKACYHAFLIHDIAGALKGIRSLSIGGASVTIPFKEAIIPYLDWIDDDAKCIGAVNTVLNRDGSLLGFNTDARGFLNALAGVANVAKKKVIVLGAGGAARAVVYALMQQGADVTVTNRTGERGERLAREFSASFLSWEEREAAEAQILVNTTPIGMYPRTEESPVDDKSMKRFELVVDIVYNPWETKLLKAAKKKGVKTIHGAEMFVQQGAEQIRIWTGLEPPVEVMRKAVKEALKNEA